MNPARKPQSLRFCLREVAIPKVESVPKLKLMGESDYSDAEGFSHATTLPSGDNRA